MNTGLIMTGWLLLGIFVAFCMYFIAWRHQTKYTAYDIFALVVVLFAGPFSVIGLISALICAFFYKLLGNVTIYRRS